MKYRFVNLGADATFEDFRAEYERIFGEDFFEDTLDDDIPTGLIADEDDLYINVVDGKVELYTNNGDKRVKEVGGFVLDSNYFVKFEKPTHSFIAGFRTKETAESWCKHNGCTMLDKYEVRHKGISRVISEDACIEIENLLEIVYMLNVCPSDKLFFTESSTYDLWKYIDTANYNNTIKDMIERYNLPEWEWECDTTDIDTDCDIDFEDSNAVDEAMSVIDNLVSDWWRSLILWIEVVNAYYDMDFYLD